MIFVVSTKNLRSDEDKLLDMEAELWELNFELGMPMWYWVNNKLRNHQISKVKILQNKINAISNKINKEVISYD